MKCLVVYAFEKGFGNVDVTFRNWPPKINDIRDAERKIQKVIGESQRPVIMNWIEISE